MRNKLQKGYFRHNRVVLFLVLVLMLIALALPVLSAPHSYTLNTLTWQENTKVNISTKTTNDASLVNVSFITVKFSASDTANSSISVIINITNTTATNFNWGYANFTFSNVIALEDTNVGSVTAISTGVGDSDTINLSATTVTIDRYAPQAPTEIRPTTGIDNTTVNQLFSATVNDANTTGCTLRFDGQNPGSSAYAMTYSTSSCTLTVNNLARGTYKFYVTATDGRNNTNSGTNTITISQLGSNVGKRAYAVAQQSGQAPTKEGVSLAIGMTEAGQAGSDAGTRFKQELTRGELTKTGIGVGTGAVVGMVIGTIAMPGIGTVAGLPLGAFIGGFLGALA